MNFFGFFKKDKRLKDYQVIYQGVDRVYDDIINFKIYNEKWGAATLDGKVIVEPKYDTVTYYKDKQFFVATRKKHTNKNTHSFIDKTGKLIKKIKGYDSIRVDEDGNIITATKNPFYRQGLLNDSFEELIAPVWNMHTIGCGLFKAESYGPKGLWGIIDRNGNEVLPLRYRGVKGSFHNSQVVAVETDDGYYLVNKQGETIKKLPYRYILPYYLFRDGVKLPERYRVIITDKEERDYWRADEMYYYDGKWGVLDNDFTELIPPKYTYIDYFKNPNYFKIAEGDMEFDDSGIYVTVTKGLFGVIDTNSNIIIPPIYNFISEKSDNSWAVNKGGRVYYNDYYQEDYWTVEGGEWEVITLPEKPAGN